jgi:hypothetical protein
VPIAIAMCEHISISGYSIWIESFLQVGKSLFNIPQQALVTPV